LHYCVLGLLGYWVIGLLGYWVIAFLRYLASCLSLLSLSFFFVILLLASRFLFLLDIIRVTAFFGGVFMSLEPYGGKLVERCVKSEEVNEWREWGASLKNIQIAPRIESDVYLLAIGALSPLEGFVSKKEYDSIINEMKLSNGLPWAIPITCQITKEKLVELKKEKSVSLVNTENKIIATLDVNEIFELDKKREAEKVFRTIDTAHPGVFKLFELGEFSVAGKIKYDLTTFIPEFTEYTNTPRQLRKKFKESGWRTIVAFQTRNPVHRAHEYLQKCALEIVDGLLLHPIVGEIKKDDIPANIRMECYKTLLNNYYPANRVCLSVLPMAMRYAGPSEAIHHSIIRRNYGCTHIIIGRDHAGVGNYYDPYDAQKIFDYVDKEKLGIIPLFFENSFYCKKCKQMATSKTCPHSEKEQVFLSGTKLRELLKEGVLPPEEFSRKEVAQILMRSL
ncbi:MAG: sulfate adenylyltransferase, partial [Candidatus Hydrogenedentota bacterium]